MGSKDIKTWFRISPWIILGSLAILVPIFVFWTMQNLNKQKENYSLLLLEKGAALIRSFEAGTRTGMRGMMGMQGTRFQLQQLLMETAQLPDIEYLIVTNKKGRIIAHNEPYMIGDSYGDDLNLRRISNSEIAEWRQVNNAEGPDTFEIFRRFSPERPHFPDRPNRRMTDILREHGIEPTYIIFVGLDMGTIEAARKSDSRHTVLMSVTLLLIVFAGIFTLFLVQAYLSAKTSLTKIKAFSDNVVENMPIGLIAIDAQGRIASYNENAESIIGIATHRMIGMRSQEILPKELFVITEEVNNEKAIIEKEITCSLANGKSVPLDTSVSRLKGDDGTFLGHIILFRDLTEVRELKREVERTRRLASLGRLAAGVAHEIRNPLSSIKGFATYFRERYLDVPEDKKTADIMIQEVERLNRVIGQLLDFANPHKVIKKSVPAEDLIQDTLRMVERQAKEKNVIITTDLSPDVDKLFIDQDKINQVFLNLYLNSIEAMDNGGTLSVALALNEDRSSVRITVSDTGCGIKKDDLVHVFDPYFTTKQSGTGLGLAIAHNIIESHMGELRLESEPGKGTSVLISLPIDDKHN